MNRNNPAVAFGGSLMGLFSWPDIWIYLLAHLPGGAAAALVFRYQNPAGLEEATGRPLKIRHGYQESRD